TDTRIGSLLFLLPVRFGLAAASVVLFAMLVYVIVNVVGRILLTITPPGTIEVVSYWWMIMIFFLGLALSYLRGEQIMLSALLDGANLRFRRFLARAIAVLSALALIALTYYSAWAAIVSFGIGETAFGIVPLPIWPAKGLIPLGFLMLLTCVVRDIVNPP